MKDRGPELLWERLQPSCHFCWWLSLSLQLTLFGQCLAHAERGCEQHIRISVPFCTGVFPLTFELVAMPSQPPYLCLWCHLGVPARLCTVDVSWFPLMTVQQPRQPELRLCNHKGCVRAGLWGSRCRRLALARDGEVTAWAAHKGCSSHHQWPDSIWSQVPSPADSTCSWIPSPHAALGLVPG